ncbi:Lsr2 family protein [Nocardiopsis sp. MG754419]|uniref:histone-like nucleoid-structuring protein Lsr2 n=1 Tax=Nocardiopsis sp. MG754419 TaxID=2259865 RepID=UPI001BA71AB8|nr:Lsr2 family protein [Nocardiopsis sp. MG754419]MBR8742034.1 Lsr2 family protein [Nocardiopsis sp. MG754419]
MAQKVQVFLVDDLDGGEAEETVTFGLDGSTYEIDLSADNAGKLRDALSPFVEASRKAPSKQGRATARRGSRNAPSRERSAEIRAWAKAAGKPVNERGRIPAAIVAEYEAIKG